MASYFTPIQRLINSYKRVLAVLLFLVLLLILYKQHTNTKSKSPVKISSNGKKEIAAAEKDIVVVDSQENPRNKHYGYDDDEHEFKNDKFRDKLKEFQLEVNNLQLQTVPDDITEKHRCPACYGKTLCSDIASGRIKVLYNNEILFVQNIM